MKNERPLAEVIASPYFVRRINRLAKKYRSLDVDLAELIEQLEAKPTTGTALGDSLYKIRMGVASKGNGKQGGFRVITYLIIETESQKTVYLVEIYDKSEVADVAKKDLQKLVRELGL